MSEAVGVGSATRMILLVSPVLTIMRNVIAPFIPISMVVRNLMGSQYGIRKKILYRGYVPIPYSEPVTSCFLTATITMPKAEAFA